MANESRIFAAGIVWDPREPLPSELQHLAQVTPPAFVAYQAARATGLPDFPTLTVQEHDRNVLPPLSISLDGSIIQDTATITTTQIFWNDSPAVIKKAAYTFPLPAECTIADFQCRIGKDRLLKGEVKPKSEAREAFKHHIRHNDTGAALLEQDTPEIFTTSLGNIPEKTKVTVSLTFVMFLKHHFHDRRGTTTLTIPTSIAKRYGSPPKDYGHASSNDVPEGLSLAIEIIEHESIRSIESNSHLISVNRHLGSRNAPDFAALAGGTGPGVPTTTVELKDGSTFLEKDFVLDIITSPDENSDVEEARAWIEEHPSLDNHKALMVTIPATFLNQSKNCSPKSEIIFLADRSGSMEDKMVSLKSAMQFFLKGIPEGRKFNIWCFGSTYSSWCPQSVDYSEWSLQAALSFVEQDFKADMGGTELLPAIQATVESRDMSLLTDIIILTDGQTWRLDETVHFIQSVRKKSDAAVRFFSLGIGDAVSHALVNRIARWGGGYAEVVPSTKQGGWEDRVVSMAKAALTSAHLGPLRIELAYRDSEGKQTSIDSQVPAQRRSPISTRTLDPFSRNRLFYLFDKPDTPPRIENISIAANSGGSERSIVIPVRSLNKGVTVHRLAAQSILDRFGQILDAGSTRGQTSAEEIACKWSLVSKWTSFVLTEEENPTPDGGLMGGIVRIINTTGEDLLQPRGRGHRSRAIDSRPQRHKSRSTCVKEECDDELESTMSPPMNDAVGYLLVSGSFSPPTHGPPPSSAIIGVPIERPINSTTYCGPEQYSSTLSVPPRSWFGFHEPLPRQEQPPVIIGTDADIIRRLLQYQTFDGSFDFGVPDDAKTSYLGRDIVGALKTILNSQPSLAWTALCTAAVIVFLWRDYRHQKDLWDLMNSKGTKYLEEKHNILADHEIFKTLREGLKHLQLLSVPVASIYSVSAYHGTHIQTNDTTTSEIVTAVVANERFKEDGVSNKRKYEGVDRERENQGKASM